MTNIILGAGIQCLVCATLIQLGLMTGTVAPHALPGIYLIVIAAVCGVWTKTGKLKKPTFGPPEGF